MLLNFLAFQLGWFACVLGGAHGMPWLGSLAAVAIVSWHLLRSGDWRNEGQLVLAACLIGLVWENLLTLQGLLVYPSGVLLAGTAPHWIIAMWALFATTLNLSLRWLQGRWWLSAMFGAIAGPLAFYAGSRLGAVSFSDPVTALVWLAVGWGVLTPLLMRLAQRFEGARARLAEAA